MTRVSKLLLVGLVGAWIGSGVVMVAQAQDAPADSLTAPPTTVDTTLTAPEEGSPWKGLPSPDKLPGGRPSVVFYVAFVLNRLLWLLKKFRTVVPEKYQPYLPALAAILGLCYGVFEAVVYGTPWLTALLTGLAGGAAAVAWREGTRAYDHYKSGGGEPPAPKKPGSMTDDELANAGSS